MIAALFVAVALSNVDSPPTGVNADCQGFNCPRPVQTLVHAVGNVLPLAGYSRLPVAGPASVAKPKPVRKLVKFVLDTPKRFAGRFGGF